MSSLPTYMKEIIELDNPKAVDEAIQNARILYQLMKKKWNNVKDWPQKKGIRATIISDTLSLQVLKTH